MGNVYSSYCSFFSNKRYHQFVSDLAHHQVSVDDFIATTIQSNFDPNWLNPQENNHSYAIVDALCMFMEDDSCRSPYESLMSIIVHILTSKIRYLKRRFMISNDLIPSYHMKNVLSIAVRRRDFLMLDYLKTHGCSHLDLIPLLDTMSYDSITKDTALFELKTHLPDVYRRAVEFAICRNCPSFAEVGTYFNDLDPTPQSYDYDLCLECLKYKTYGFLRNIIERNTGDMRKDIIRRLLMITCRNNIRVAIWLVDQMVLNDTLENVETVESIKRAEECCKQLEEVITPDMMVPDSATIKQVSSKTNFISFLLSFLDACRFRISVYPRTRRHKTVQEEFISWIHSRCPQFSCRLDNEEKDEKVEKEHAD